MTGRLNDYCIGLLIKKHTRQHFISASARKVYIWELSGKESPLEIIKDLGIIRDISCYGDYIVTAESKCIHVLRFSGSGINDNKARPKLTLPIGNLKKLLWTGSTEFNTSTICKVELGCNASGSVMQLLVCDRQSVSHWTWKTGELPRSLSCVTQIVHGLDHGSINVYWALSQGEQRCILFGNKEGAIRIGVGKPNGGLKNIEWTKPDELPYNLQLIDFSRTNGWLVLRTFETGLHDFRTIYIWDAMEKELIGCITDVTRHDAGFLSATKTTASFIVLVESPFSQTIKRYYIDIHADKPVTVRGTWRHRYDSYKRTSSHAECSGSGALAIPYTSRQNGRIETWYSVFRDPISNPAYILPTRSRYRDSSDGSEYSYVEERTIEGSQNGATDSEDNSEDIASIDFTKSNCSTDNSLISTGDTESIEDLEEVASIDSKKRYIRNTDQTTNQTDSEYSSEDEEAKKSINVLKAGDYRDELDDRESLSRIEDSEDEENKEDSARQSMEDSGAWEIRDDLEDREILSSIEGPEGEENRKNSEARQSMDDSGAWETREDLEDREILSSIEDSEGEENREDSEAMQSTEDLGVGESRDNSDDGESLSTIEDSEDRENREDLGVGESRDKSDDGESLSSIEDLEDRENREDSGEGTPDVSCKYSHSG